MGEVEITAEDYARALQNEIRAQIAQTQTPVNLADLRARGLDEAVLQSLVARAALANEAQQLGLSVGDAAVARQIQDFEAFEGRERRLRPRGLRIPPRAGGAQPPASSRRTRARTPPGRSCNRP